MPKISPGAYIFQRPFWRGLYSEGLIYEGKFAFRNRLGQPYSWKEIYRLCFVLLCIWGQFSTYKPPRGLYLEGRFNGGIFALQVWGAYIWRGLYIKGLIFGILRYVLSHSSVDFGRSNCSSTTTSWERYINTISLFRLAPSFFFKARLGATLLIP